MVVTARWRRYARAMPTERKGRPKHVVKIPQGLTYEEYAQEADHCAKDAENRAKRIRQRLWDTANIRRDVADATDLLKRAELHHLAAARAIRKLGMEDAGHVAKARQAKGRQVELAEILTGLGLKP